MLLIFSDVGRVNIIAGDGVEGQVTMRLTSVPWDQALDIILRSLRLGMVQEGNIVRIATLQTLEDERQEAIDRANAQVKLKPLETRLIPLSYATVDEMAPKVGSVLSSRGQVTPDTRTNTLIGWTWSRTSPSRSSSSTSRYDAAGDHRGPHRGGSNDLAARARDPVGL